MLLVLQERLLLHHMLSHLRNILRIALTVLLSLLHLHHLLLRYLTLPLRWSEHPPLCHLMHDLLFGALLEDFPLCWLDKLVIPAKVLISQRLEQLLLHYAHALSKELLHLH